MTFILLLLHNPYVKAALGGFAAGIAVDYHAFLAFKTTREFAEYDWNTALFRGFQGAIAAVVVAAGVGLA